MKKILTVLILSLTVTAALANPYHGHRHYPRHHHHHHYDWVVPAIIGGAVVYGITQSRVTPPPPPVVVQVPQAPVGYHYESILDANCNCYKTVLVPN